MQVFHVCFDFGRRPGTRPMQMSQLSPATHAPRCHPVTSGPPGPFGTAAPRLRPPSNQPVLLRMSPATAASSTSNALAHASVLTLPICCGRVLPRPRGDDILGAAELRVSWGLDSEHGDRTRPGRKAAGPFL